MENICEQVLQVDSISDYKDLAKLNRLVLCMGCVQGQVRGCGE